MKKTALILTTLAFIAGSCGQATKKQSAKTEKNLSADTIVDTIQMNENRQSDEHKQWKTSFKSISELVAYEYSTWMNANDSIDEFRLVFDLRYNDTLKVCYASNCWLNYPYKVEDDKIIVYWDVLIDTKYEFDIVKAIWKTDKKLIGKTFVILTLENDTTLKATYLMKDLIDKINGSSSKTNNIFFPDKYYLINLNNEM